MGIRRGRQVVTGVLGGGAVALAALAITAVAAAPASAQVQAGFAVPGAGRISATVFRMDVDLGPKEKAPLTAGAEPIRRRQLAKNVVLVGTIRRLRRPACGKASYVGVVALVHARPGRDESTAAEGERICWRRRPAGADPSDDAQARLFTGLPARVAGAVQERGSLTQQAALLSTTTTGGRCRRPDLTARLQRGLSELLGDDRRSGPNFSWSATKTGPEAFGDAVIDAVGGAVISGQLSRGALRTIERELGRRFGVRFGAGSLDGDRAAGDETTTDPGEDTARTPASATSRPRLPTPPACRPATRRCAPTPPRRTSAPTSTRTAARPTRSSSTGPRPPTDRRLRSRRRRAASTRTPTSSSACAPCSRGSARTRPTTSASSPATSSARRPETTRRSAPRHRRRR